MFSQMAQQPQPPQGAPPQNPQMPQGAMPPSAQGAPPQGGGIPPQILQMLMAQLQQQAPQQIAAQGRGGDNMIAHLTPGEMMVPPQVQTPKVLATLKKAYETKGVDPQQFTAGSSASSVNPQTGVPEYNFMSAFLPAALGLAGAAAAPFTGGASLGLSSAALAALGGGLGTAAGGLITGQSPTQAALSGLGAGAGGYLLSGAGGQLGNLLGKGGGEAATAAADQQLANVVTAPTQAAAASAASNAPTVMGSQALGNFNPMSAAGSAIGGSIGNSMGAPPTSNSPNYPKGFMDPMPAVGSLGSAQQQLGMNNSAQPRPTFGGYNPAVNNPAAYNFGFAG